MPNRKDASDGAFARALIFMKKFCFGFFATVAAMVFATNALAQTSIQRLHFSLLAYYQKDVFTTNTSTSAGPLTNQYSTLRNILIGTGNIVKAMAVDLDGTNTATNNWRGSELVREVNLVDGTEGIFLRKNGSQTNVSSFFGITYSNNFQAGLFAGFPLVANGFTNVTYPVGNLATNLETNAFTNVIVNTNTNCSTAEAFTNVFTNYVTNVFDQGTGVTVTNNFMLENPLVRGSLQMTGPTNFETNIVGTAGLYFLSFNTTNLKFNILCVGTGSSTNVAGTIDGTHYARAVDYQTCGCAGDYYLNTTTNIFDLGAEPPVYVTGPLRGSFASGIPFFSRTNGP